jgi:large subunit ribosomal protein L15
MPPRLSSLAKPACCALRQPSAAVPSIVSMLASLSIGSTRHASILANLRDNAGAYNKRIRVGRGASSGKGKTSGRGHKGQGQHGKVKPWFQGGQTPLVVQRGIKGFENRYGALLRATAGGDDF